MELDLFFRDNRNNYDGEKKSSYYSVSNRPSGTEENLFLLIFFKDGFCVLGSNKK